MAADREPEPLLLFLCAALFLLDRRASPLAGFAALLAFAAAAPAAAVTAAAFVSLAPVAARTLADDRCVAVCEGC